MNISRRTMLATALSAAMGVTTTASADTITASYSGWFTMLNAGGTAATLNSDLTGNVMNGWRSAITGAMSFNTHSSTVTATMAGFSFRGGGLAEATNISLQAVGNGTGGLGTLVLANLAFNWNGNNGIPVSLVLDASGLFSAAASGLTTSDVITGGVKGATDSFLFGFGASSYTLPMGSGPVMSTTFNTTDIGIVTLGSNPSGTLPFTDDGIGGSPAKAGVFPNFNLNFDVTSLQVISVSSVPVPAAVWLFGSGLVVLTGVARRKKFT